MSHLSRLAAALLPVVLSLASAPIRADTLSTFTFSGTCADCTGSAAATLVLTDYTIGAALTSGNFVSLTYAGTDLLAPFTVTSSQLYLIDGNFGDPLPGPETFTLLGGGQTFFSSSTGFWCVGGGCNADYGLTHVWSIAEANTDVPEPMSIALLGGGLLGLAAFNRKP